MTWEFELSSMTTEMEMSNGKLQESPTEDDVETIQMDAYGG